MQAGVLIIGAYEFPYGDAPSNRILAIAKTFKEAGYEPLVIGNGTLEAARYNDTSGWHEVEGIAYTSVRRPPSVLAGLQNRFLRTWSLLRALRRVDLADFRYIYVTQGTLTSGIKILCAYVWRRPLIVDCMEWFEPAQFKHGRASLRFIAFAYRFHVLCRRTNIVAISSLLAKKMRSRNLRVLQMPPQIDMNNFSPLNRERSRDRLEVLYAGTAGRKDHLSSALEALTGLPAREKSQVRLTIAGPDRAEVEACLPDGGRQLDALGSSVRILGRVPRAEILRLLAESDFSVLLRPTSRYSAAGFPSKVPESLAAGVPPLVTMTRDLRAYLTDGVDCLEVAECSTEAFATALKRALSLSRTELDAMRDNARACARLNFDYRAWTVRMSEFLKEIRA